MKILISLLILTLSSLASNDFIAGEISSRLRKELENIKISGDVDFFDGDIFSGIGSKISYKYQMEPSFVSNKFLRFDEWRVLNEVRVGDILDNASPVHFNIASNTSIYFVRSFDTQLKAITARPYSINKIPYNSKTVIERMNEGEFFSFPSTLSLKTGLTLSPTLGPHSISSTIETVLEGIFTISIYRLHDQKVRLKLVAEKNRGLQGKVDANVSDNIIGISILDKTLDQLLVLDLLEFFAQKSKGEQYILDYDFDLSYPLARQAFDEILNPKKKFNLKEVLNKYKGIEYFEDKLISDYALAEKLQGTGQGVERNFKGFNNYTFKKTGIKFGLLVSTINSGRAYYKNNVVLEDEFGEVKKYFFPNRIHFYEEETDLKVLSRKDELETSFYGLLEVNDKDKNSPAQLDVGVSHWRDDDFLNKFEWQKVKQEIYDILPTDIVENINFHEFEKNETKTNSRITFQIVFKDKALDYLGNVDFEEFHQQMKKIVKERVVFKKTFFGKIFASTISVSSNIFGIKNLSIKKFTKEIHYILSTDEIDSKARVTRILDLPDSFLFKRYAIKLFLNIIPRDLWNEYVYINVEMKANGVKSVKYESGQLEMREVLEQVLQVNKQFYSPAHDLRAMVEND